VRLFCALLKKNEQKDNDMSSYALRGKGKYFTLSDRTTGKIIKQGTFIDYFKAAKYGTDQAADLRQLMAERNIKIRQN